ncbi:transcriptional regulator [Sporosarcina ureae]|uniref:response regulator n=1 Tax=Sporosarcina ureae TaxID=1571 RepID=UPI000A16B5D7|nr:response regulator [Sporosarcina ureae]ARJ39702.1 transcriptional regulator [Sporosarcina ureae]
MISTIQVIIVEDDFRVAEINRQLIEQITGYKVVTETRTASETIAFLRQAEALPNLILLDVYIPDSPGLDLFWHLRREFPTIDIMLLTAAKETKIVEEALHGGVLDYLIKPVEPVRFAETFRRYRSRKVLLSSKNELSQEDLDRVLFGTEMRQDPTSNVLPKGIDRLTLERIENVLLQSPAEGITAVQVGEAAGVSRSTARRYLEYLVSVEIVGAQLHYGDVGRPERTYRKL